MKEIDIFNYNIADAKDKVYNVPVKLIIRKISYEAAKRAQKFHKNRSTIAFQNVAFNSEVSINVDEGIDKDISIDFFRCFIDRFSPFDLESKNVSLYFGGCLVDNFVARDVDLKSVKFNNCFGTFFLINLKKCEITYTEENIFIKEWIKLVSLSRFDSLVKILSYKTSYHLTNVENIIFYGNEIDDERRSELLNDNKHFYLDIDPLSKAKKKMLLSKEQKLKLNLNVSLTYKVQSNHLNTKVSNLLLNSVSLNGKAEGEITMEDCKVDNVYIRNFSPNGSFTLYNIETRGLNKGKFEVHNSNLDNTWFNSVKLNQYFIVFFKSSFVNTKFYSTIFPSTKELLDSSLASVENIHYPDKKSEKSAYNRDMYELFLELTQAFEKRGNVFEAQKMKAVSHNFLNKITTSKFWKSEFWNSTTILFLNKVSNFHGVSVRNAFLLIIGFVLFFHYLNVLSYKSYSFTFNSWEDMWNVFNHTKRYVFILANPAHRVSSLAPLGEITGYTYALSFLSRIVIGYLYYQFIAAFRRFGK